MNHRFTFVFGVLAALIGCSSSESGPAVDAGADGGRSCPATGGTMARVQGMCIDRTEVTRGEYGAFLPNAAALDKSKLSAECQGISAFAPDATCDASSVPGCGANCGEYPQTCVNYCQAEAFCVAAGKTLCGDALGSQVAISATRVPSDLAWYSICGNGVRIDGFPNRRYAYGNDFQPGLCTDTTVACPGDGSSCRSEPVGKRSQCRLPEAEVFDMAGNVSEWLRAKEIPEVEGGRHAFAGSSRSTLGSQTGRCQDLGLGAPAYFSEDLGFRCCAK